MGFGYPDGHDKFVKTRRNCLVYKEVNLQMLSAGVEHGVKLLDASGLDVGVDLGCGEVGVAEHLLNHPQVSAVFKQVGGEGVAQHMRRDVLFHTCCKSVFLDKPENVFTPDSAARTGEEESTA